MIELLKYMEHSTDEVSEACESKRIQEMHRRVCRIKASEKTEVKYMQAWEEKLLERQKEKRELLRKMNHKMSIEKIADVLDMTVEEALEFFENIPKIKQKIQTLYDVGLGYIKLGQPSTTLSGGEAQRVKLATELSKKATGKTLYILDEPTTGLHIADVHKLVDILQRLVDTGNSVIVIEHNLDLIKTCDYIIDLGPEGGEKGGEILCVGTPEQIVKNEKSYTGKFLKKYLEK